MAHFGRTALVLLPLLVAAAISLVFFPELSWAYLKDKEEHPPPADYFTFLPPAVGKTYVDPVFGSTIKRLSDAVNTLHAGNGSGTLAFVINEYSTMSPFNQDNSRLLLAHQAYFALYDGDGNYIRDLPFEINPASEPRWSRQDANVLYYVYGNQLRTYNTAAGAISVASVFSEYSRISGKGESDICFDGDHLVLVGDNTDVFVYEISTDRRGPVLNTEGLGDFDSVYITPEDNVLVGWYARGTSRYQGVELYDRNMNFLRHVAPAIGHMDVARDLDGEEVLIWANAADPTPICDNGIVKIRLSDGEETCLLALKWGLAVHISAPDPNGWCFVTTYYANFDANPVLDWGPYTNEILQVKLDGSEIRRLAHHRSRPFNTYNWTPRAAASRDGSRLVYSSNYGLQSILGLAPEYSDAYLLTVRFEESDSPVRYSCAWYRNDYFQHSAGSAILAMDPGANTAFDFTGTGVSWVGYCDEWSGMANVYVDGFHYGRIDTFAPAAWPQARLFTLTGLPFAPHRLLIEAAGTRNPDSRGFWVWVDCFEALSADSEWIRFEENAAAVHFGPCPWYRNDYALHSGGFAILAMDAGAQVLFPFTGTGVKWIGYRDQWSGIARIYVDGIYQGEVDTYAPSPQPQAVMWTLAGLLPGRHIVVVEVTGHHNFPSEGKWVWVDAFEPMP